MTRHNETAVTVMAVAITATLGLQAIQPRAAQPAAAPPQPPPAATPSRHHDIDSRVAVMAEAIANAEGYYAPGVHGGRSLLYRLNNPGGLKKPALGAADLSTWQDTGLVIFTSPEKGWAALREQVRAILTGTSRMYEASDTLLHVASKYADGDLNWGLNVAAHMGVPPTSTVAEVAAAAEARKP